MPGPCTAVTVVAGVYPGWGGRWVGREGAIPVPHPTSPRTLIFHIFKAKGPTYGQMKANIDPFMRFLR